jgi:hypothetical protein
MSIAAIKQEVARFVAQAKEQVHEAEKALASGADEEKVAAAGRLEFYKAEQAAFEARLAELENCPDNALENIIQGIRKEWLIQKELFEERSVSRRF